MVGSMAKVMGGGMPIGAHTIRMIPPLIITGADCDKAVAILRETVESLG